MLTQALPKASETAGRTLCANECFEKPELA